MRKNAYIIATIAAICWFIATFTTLNVVHVFSFSDHELNVLSLEIAVFQLVVGVLTLLMELFMEKQ